MLLASEYDATYNYAKSGAGNEYIFHSLVEADTNLQLTKDDTVIIMWSGYHRFDHFDPEIVDPYQWKTQGDWIHWAERSLMEKYLHEVGWVKKSLNYMLATERYLTARGIPFIFASLYDLENDTGVIGDNKEIAMHIKGMSNFVFPQGANPFILNYRGKNLATDGHPSMAEHLLIAEIISGKSTHNRPYFEQLLEVQSKWNTISQSQHKELNERLVKIGALTFLTASSNRLVSTNVDSYRPDIMVQYIKEIYQC
jgi:hypothetical protein